MLLDSLFILLGLVGLVVSSDKFVSGASNLALNLKMSPLLVGILFVGIGTSLPEVLVSTSASLDGSDLALGNAIGSNISNIALIIGITALFIPITVKRALIKKEFMLLVGSTAFGVYLLSDGALTRMDALMLLFGLIFVLYFFIASAKNDKETISEHDEDVVIDMSLNKSILYTVVGMAFLVGFSKLLVVGAVSLASSLGVSDVVIGLTIVSVGTSLPELSSCVAAVRQKQADLAIGNIVGSNIFNILAVLSVSGLVFPMPVSNELLIRDIPLMVILTIGFLLFSFSPSTDGKIGRFKGFILLSIFVAYMTALVVESMGIFNVTAFLNATF